MRISDWSSDVCSSDLSSIDDVILGCANQAGEDNRNVARMSALLAGMPVSCPGTTVNRLCASGLEAVAQAARAVCSSEANLVLAGGVESMTRAPFVMGKSSAAYARTAKLEDTTMGWRFVNRSEEHTSELQSLMRISSAVFCL